MSKKRKKEVVDVQLRSSDWRGRRLCNLDETAFRLDKNWINSIQGLMDGILYPPGDGNRRYAFHTSGIDSKPIGAKAEKKWVWWKDQKLAYGSPAHMRLIERAMRARFRQDHDARVALAACGNVRFIHEPKNGTSKPHCPRKSFARC